jgi:hypothetical protein
VLLQDFFSVGDIYTTKQEKKQGLYYRVRKIDELPIVVKHFDQYPLQGEKRAKYDLWRQMVLLKTRFRAYDKRELLNLTNQLTKLSMDKE